MTRVSDFEGRSITTIRRGGVTGLGQTPPPQKKAGGGGPSADSASSCVEPGMSMVAVVASVAASTKCTLCAVLAVTIRFGPPTRLLRSIICVSGAASTADLKFLQQLQQIRL